MNLHAGKEPGGVFTSGNASGPEGSSSSAPVIYWDSTPCRHQAGTEGSAPPKSPAQRGFPPVTQRAELHHTTPSAGMRLLNKINAKRQKQNSPLELQGRCLIQHFILFSPLFFLFLPELFFHLQAAQCSTDFLFSLLMGSLSI